MNTTLLPIAPVSPFERLNTMMEELFPTPAVMRAIWHPPVDIRETDKEFLFLMEVPALNRENVDVELLGDTLVIRGKREQEKMEAQENWVRKERHFGTFQRSFRLDVPVLADKIDAQYKDGLLQIHVPKAELVKPKRIPIKV